MNVVTSVVMPLARSLGHAVGSGFYFLPQFVAKLGWLPFTIGMMFIATSTGFSTYFIEKLARAQNTVNYFHVLQTNLPRFMSGSRFIGFILITDIVICNAIHFKTLAWIFNSVFMDSDVEEKCSSEFICFFVTTLYILLPEIWGEKMTGNEGGKENTEERSSEQEQAPPGVNIFASKIQNLAAVQNVFLTTKKTDTDGNVAITNRNLNLEMTRLGPNKKLGLVFILCQVFAYFKLWVVSEHSFFSWKEMTGSNWIHQMFLALPVILYAFVNYQIMFPVKTNKFGLAEGDYKKVIWGSKVLLLTLYMAISYLIYATFGDGFSPFHLEACSGVSKYVLAILALFSLINTMNLNVMVRCKVIQTALLEEKDTTRETFIIISALTIFASMLVTTLTEDALSLIYLNGCGTNNLISTVLPSIAFMYRYCKGPVENTQQEDPIEPVTNGRPMSVIAAVITFVHVLFPLFHLWYFFVSGYPQMIGGHCSAEGDCVAA